MADERWWDQPRHGDPRPWAEPEPLPPRSFAEHVERILMQLTILGLVLLVLVQSLQTLPTLRRFLNLADRLEGIHYADLLPRPGTQAAPQPGAAPAAPARAVATPAPAGRLTVTLVSRRSAPAVKLLVGGQVAGDFRAGSVATVVPAGVEVAVDARGDAGLLHFRVVRAEGLGEPRLGLQVSTRGDVRRLGITRAP